MTAETAPVPHLDLPLPDQRVGLAIAPGIYAEYSPRSDWQLIIDTLTETADSGYAYETLTVDAQPGFSSAVHAAVSEHFWARYSTVVRPQPITSPLPKLPMQARLREHYQDPNIHKGSPDRKHLLAIDSQQLEFIPLAISWATRLPEIGVIAKMREHLQRGEHEVAADALSDLLIVYGQSVRAIINHGENEKKRLRAVSASRLIVSRTVQ